MPWLVLVDEEEVVLIPDQVTPAIFEVAIRALGREWNLEDADFAGIPKRLLSQTS